MEPPLPLYTFYPCREDGTSATFETYDLPDDSAAFVRGHAVAEAHPSCTHVAIWCGDRKVRYKAEPTKERRSDADRPSA
jgi:hypothetical protein